MNHLKKWIIRIKHGAMWGKGKRCSGEPRNAPAAAYGLGWLLTMTLLFNLSACAAGGRMFNHQFSFDTVRDSSDGKTPEVEILDYQYGDSRQFGTYADKEFKEYVSLGRKRYTGGLHGFMPLGEFLYVKWRILATGEVYEDRVDLRSRLTKDVMSLDSYRSSDPFGDINIHFVVKGAQLYIVLRYPWDGKPLELKDKRRLVELLPIPREGVRFQGSRHVQIYPDPLPE